jgi:hypothetical protein
MISTNNFQTCDDSVEVIQRVLQLNLNKLLKWFKNNSMMINVGKTKSMLIHPPRHPTHQINLKINNVNIENVNSFTYLGVIIDDKLTWNDHFESV